MPDFIINIKTKGGPKAEISLKNVIKKLGAFTAAYLTAQKAVDLFAKSIDQSARMEGVKRGFDNLTKSAGFSERAFQNFAKATDGTIDSLTLMTKANNAMLLGITDSEDQMAEMFDIAQRLGQSLGIDTVQSIDSLVTGLGRQSKLMLDNLGIMVDTNQAYTDYAEQLGISVTELTDQQRKQAFVNASMDEAKRLVGQLGEEQLTTKDSIAQMNTAFSDLSVVIGDKMSDSIQTSTGFMTKYVNKFAEFLLLSGDLNKETLDSITNESTLIKAREKLTNEVGLLNEGLKLANLQEFFGMDETENAKNARLEIERLQLEIAGINQKLLEGNILYRESTLIQSDQARGILNNMEIRRDATTDYLAGLQKVEEKETKLSEITEEARKKQEQLDKERTQQTLEGLAKQGGGAVVNMKRVVKAESMKAVSSLIAQMLATVPYPANLILAAGAGGLVSNLISTGLEKIPNFATGGDFVTSGPQLMMVGDNPGGQERVQITPLSSPNMEGPQGDGIVVNVSGNVLTQDFVDNDLAEAIKTSIRRNGAEQFGLN